MNHASSYRSLPAFLAILTTVVFLNGCAAAQNRPMQLVSGSGPTYPTLAKAEGIEGAVVVRYGVSLDGRVINARIDSAEPEGVFEDAALKAVRSWRYNPALKDGEPVAVDNVLSTVRFELTANDRYRDQ
jgi:protein TonB